MKNKPHLTFKRGIWLASLGEWRAIGSSPMQAIMRLNHVMISGGV